MNGVRQSLIVGLLLCGSIEFAGCAAQSPRATAPPEAPTVMAARATAYSGGSRTASGTRPRPGIVAADPSVLPLGSHIRVSGAGAYSGDYVVRDTGGRIRGRRIDIYMRRHAQAKRFGVRHVKVRVLSYGPASRHTPHHRHRRRHRRHRHAGTPGHEVGAAPAYSQAARSR